MFTQIKTPSILEKQQKVMEWSRKLRSKYIDFSTIIEYLVSDRKANSEIIDDGLDEARKIYNEYNGYWRGQLLTALMINNFRLENDFEEGSIVTDGNYLGYAFNVNYKTREFELYCSKYEEDLYDFDLIGDFKMDDFWKVETV